ncbi:GIY-YIG nuclease family protein [Ulvibacterium marinum]|uniref:GIY-YIG nuclease family protein n=1 Tax=Ulvibacterium marinum TaxID=2419782 RepID=UPI0024951BDD|nr:GIY-YIG nuclease family protein [Ulvibacterium marinum]
MKTYHVYILKCSDNSFYTGITGNFEQRWIQHQVGYFKDCYTFQRRPLSLVYFLEFNDVIQAIRFEKQLKGWSKAKKLALITGNFDRLQLLSECRNFTHFKYKPEKG